MFDGALEYCEKHNVTLGFRGEIFGQALKGSGNKVNPDAKLEQQLKLFGVDLLENGNAIRQHYGNEHNLIKVANEINVPCSTVVVCKPKNIDELFEAGKKMTFAMTQKKWVVNKTTGTGTAIFDGAMLDADGNMILETKKVIVGILLPEEIHALRAKYGGELGVKAGADASTLSGLTVPVNDDGTMVVEETEKGFTVNATQAISPALWPLAYHFKGDPVVPGNFGTHGMITLLKQVATEQFGMANPTFKYMFAKKFSGMIFEDPKQIRFELTGVTKTEEGTVVAALASLYLETSDGELMIEAPIYTFKKLTVAEA